MLYLWLTHYNSTDVKGIHCKKHRIPLKPTNNKYEMALHCYISGKFICIFSVSLELVESVSSAIDSITRLVAFVAEFCIATGRHCIVEGVHWGLESMAYNMGRHVRFMIVVG